MTEKNKKVLQRFVNNYTAIAGVCIIFLFTCLAIFAYFIIPDNSPNANEQFTVLAGKKPGFNIYLLTTKKETQPTNNFFKTFFLGDEKSYNLTPVIAEFGSGENIMLKEYRGEGFPTIDYSIQEIADKLYFKDPKQNLEKTYFWLGTDYLGRDVLSRLILGARVSLLVGFVSVLISTFIGVVVGSFAGFYRGWVDRFIMWNLSVFWSIPTLLLAMALYISLKDIINSSYVIIFIAVGLTSWVGLARIVRGQVLGYREMQFVEAAGSLGFSNNRILFKHILPNIAAPIIVIAAANFANAILVEAGLSFLGLGIQPPTPSWGNMLAEFKNLIGTDLTYLALFPGILIMLLVLSFNLVGNGLRDAMDIKNYDNG